MILSKLYTNRSDLFEPVFFKTGLNVVYCEMRVPEDKNIDNHNSGKSALSKVVDFAFLSKCNPDFFLFEKENVFKFFVFFIELKLNDDSYLTVRRSVAQASKISFKKHKKRYQDYVSLADESWEHLDVTFDRAKKLLDSFLDLSAIKPWTYRNSLGYLIRSQDDYNDVCKLRKFRSRDADWKPYLSHILGFDSDLLKRHYQKEKELGEKKGIENTIKKELTGSIEDINKIEGLLLIKREDIEKKQRLLDSFDFREQDKDKIECLVDELDEQIAELNNRQYSLKQNRKKIIKSLEEDKIIFNTDDAHKIFQEAGLLFSGQVKKDFDQLIAFNKSITKERSEYLRSEKSEIESEISEINHELNKLGKKRSDLLSFLSETEVFTKYKKTSNELVYLRADIETLDRQKTHIHRLQELRSEIRKLSDEYRHLQSEIESDVEQQSSEKTSLFSQIRLYFSEIVDDVINRKALLSVSPNSEGHLQFRVEILDESGNSTSAAMGHTYKKLLCIAFDLSVLRAHMNKKFPHFVFYDGIFESLDDRKKENLLAVIRQYADMGIQSIITLIDSDLPHKEKKEISVFDESEIVLQLHDEGKHGRLFKMETW
ncbi:MAG: DUF2326 domain-containing protein [Pseudomonadota bacterium]